MPNEEQGKHERLGTLGSGPGQHFDIDAGGKQGVATRFRPKNFAKPEGRPKPHDPGRIVKKESHRTNDLTEITEHRKGRSASSSRKKKELEHDQVVFGGGIGAASRAPRRASASARGSTGEPASCKARNMHTQKNTSQADARDVEIEDKDVHTDIKIKEEQEHVSDSSSCDEQDDGNDLDRPTTLTCPDHMPQTVEDIDTDTHARASDYISHIFSDSSSGSLMLFQIPEKLPIVKPEDMDAETHPQACSNLRDLPNKSLGKLFIMKSGKVKMKVGDIMFDVTRGVECRERQELAVIDKKHANFITLGAIQNRITISPDTISLLQSDQDENLG